MLTIRAEQMKTFSDQRDYGFHSRLVEHVQTIFPAKAAAEGRMGLRLRVQQAVEAARGYGLQTERQIATFVDLTFMAGRRFHRRRWAQAILGDDELPPGVKVRRLQVETMSRSGGGTQ